MLTLLPTPTNRCFADKLELQIAIDDYLVDPSESSSIALLYGHPMNTWCVSQITDFSDLFSIGRNSATAMRMNEPINGWDVSNASTMRLMFWGAEAFNQDLSSWDTSNVVNMAGVFRDAKAFNHDSVASWDTSNAEQLNGMFRGAEAFNVDLSHWQTSKVTSTRNMFNGASAFNQPIGSWDLSSVVDVSAMFFESSSFNQNLCGWLPDIQGRTIDEAAMLEGTSCPDSDAVLELGAEFFCRACSEVTTPSPTPSPTPRTTVTWVSSSPTPATNRPTPSPVKRPTTTLRPTPSPILLFDPTFTGSDNSNKATGSGDEGMSNTVKLVLLVSAVVIGLGLLILAYPLYKMLMREGKEDEQAARGHEESDGPKLERHPEA